MEDAVLRGFAAFGIMVVWSIVLAAAIIGLLFLRDWWQNYRALKSCERLVAANLHKPLADCTCACRWLNQDPTCPIHGEPDPPRDLVEGGEAEGMCTCLVPNGWGPCLVHD